MIFSRSGVSPTEPLILTNTAVSSIRIGSAIIDFAAVDQASMTSQDGVSWIEAPITSTPQQAHGQRQPFSSGVAGTTFAPLGSSKNLQNTGFNLGADIHPIQPGTQQRIATVRKPDTMTFTLSSPPTGNSPTVNPKSILDDGYASPNPANDTPSP